MSDLLLSFYGDDFTGSTDAMESLARSGLRTILFTNPPSREQLAKFDGLRAFGVAGMTRSMPPDEMERTLRPAFAAIRACGAPIVHYKVCSTFDSSPTVGSIGRAIDIGTELFEAPCVPVVVGAPALGRYCVFGNLFARCGAESEPYRLDRHPSMSRHPTTPMAEADIRLHLAKQTDKAIGLIDVLALQGNPGKLSDIAAPVILIDLLNETQLEKVGRLISSASFVVGSSGVESALAAFWQTSFATFAPVTPAAPILVLCGSCSPVTGRQIAHAEERGFASLSFDARDAREATKSLREGRSAMIHTLRVNKHLDVGATLGRLARDVIEATGVKRVVVAGGDTSGQIARALGIESLEMIGELTRGSPLCRATAPGSPADGIEITFKGGQIGKVDFFATVQSGISHA